MKSKKLGKGGRFAALVNKLEQEGKGAESARKIAAAAGRRKYGSSQMAKWAAAGRKRAK